MHKSNENLELIQKTGKLNQANIFNLTNLNQISRLILLTNKKRNKITAALPKDVREKVVLIDNNSPLASARVRAEEYKLSVNPSNHPLPQLGYVHKGQVQDLLNKGRNQFNSTTNSLHYEKNVVVLKNSKFLFSRLECLAQEKPSMLEDSNRQEGKTNYYNNYKTQLQNYIIEKYKNIAALNAEEDFKNNLTLAFQKELKKTSFFFTALLGDKASSLRAGEEQIRVKKLLNLLGAYARKIVKKDYSNPELKKNLQQSPELHQITPNIKSLSLIEEALLIINNHDKPIFDLNNNTFSSANLKAKTGEKGEELVESNNFKWNEKVNKKSLDNIKKGTLLPKNILQYISSNTKTSIVPTSSQTMPGKPTKEARLRQYLNLISNTNIGVNLAIPTNNNLLLMQPSNINSLNNSSVARDFAFNSNSTLAKIEPCGPSLGQGQKKANGLLLKYNKIISYNFLPTARNYKEAMVNKTVSYQAKDNLLSVGSNKNLTTAPFVFSDAITKAKEEKAFIDDLYKLLFYYFKSIYCLIGKPVIQFSSNKITINLFYFLNIPKKKVLKLFAIHYLNSFKDKYIRRTNIKLYLRDKEKIKNRNRYSSEFFPGPTFPDKNAYNVKLPFIRFKYKRSISRLKSKNNFIQSLLINLRKFNIALVYFRKFKIISKILSNKFNKPIEFNLIRLHKPSLDSNILVNLLQLIVKNKKRKPRVAINKIYKKNKVCAPAMQGRLPVLNKKGNNRYATSNIFKNKITTYLSGLSIYINGRLMREPILPRITTKKFESGASASGKVNYLDVSSITKKNRKGAYTIKIKTGQNLY